MSSVGASDGLDVPFLRVRLSFLLIEVPSDCMSPSLGLEGRLIVSPLALLMV